MARQCPCYASFMQERITVTIKRTNRRNRFYIQQSFNKESRSLKKLPNKDIPGHC